MAANTSYLDRLSMALDGLSRCHGYCEAMVRLPRGRAFSDERIIFEALFIAFVVSYARCFCSSKTADKEDYEAVSCKFGGLRLKVVNSFSTREASLHNRLLGLRHQVFAHSQADKHDPAYSNNLAVSIGSNQFYPPESQDIEAWLGITIKMIAAVASEQIEERKRVFPTAGL
jgi:hypothetical protein